MQLEIIVFWNLKGFLGYSYLEKFYKMQKLYTISFIIIN